MRSAAAGSINHVRLTVSELSVAERFYGPLLEYMGYQLEKKDQERLAWSVPDGYGGLRKFILSATSPDSANKKHDRLAPGLHHLGFNVSSREAVDAFHRLLVSRDVHVLDAPAEYSYQPGYYAVYFLDPDGIKLEVVHIPSRSTEK